MYLKHNELKSAVLEKFIRTLRNKIYKHMAAVSKNLHIDKPDEIVHKYNNTFHNTIRMKPVNVNLGIYFKYNVDHNDKGPKFRVGNHVKMSKYKNIFANSTHQIGLRKSL